MWRIRLSRELPRYLLSAAAAFGIAASARLAIAPPRTGQPPNGERTAAVADRAAEGYAVLFARRYLTWNAASPQSSQEGLEPFLGAGAEPGAGVVLPASGEQRVEWAEVVQAREPASGEKVYTVAAQTDSAGLVYLAVDVARATGGQLQLVGYPAFVGPPASGPRRSQSALHEVAESALGAVAARALRNYLAGSAGELAADLSPGARVSVPTLALTLDSVEHLEWTEPGRTLLAVTQAHDSRGVAYELAYELDVVRQQGRWEVLAIQTDPDS
jgi:hypothetical protein